MSGKIKALVFIFAFTCVAWFILGNVTKTRTYQQNVKLAGDVGQIWGTIQVQHAPTLHYFTQEVKEVKTETATKTTTENKVSWISHPVNIEGSDINVKLDLEHRKKGLLWYPTYMAHFNGKYTVKNGGASRRTIHFNFSFPTTEGVYQNFSFKVDNKRITGIKSSNGMVSRGIELEPGEAKTVEVSYESQGTTEWWYSFGSNVEQIDNFRLVMQTNFDRIDFPVKSISPVNKEKNDTGWKLTWEYSNLISGIQIGMTMPEKINPGPFVTRVSFFAPVSFFLFLFLMFIITTTRKMDIHPMNYFFIATGFFSFHLLMSYLADQVHIGIAFAICSFVSMFLVISYMRLVVNIRFALVEIGISQFVYLVIFSAAFFLQGITGLAIAVLTIITIFIVMQATGKVDWSKFDKAKLSKEA